MRGLPKKEGLGKFVDLRGEGLGKKGGGGAVWGGVDTPMPTMTLLSLWFQEMQDWRIGDHIKEENVLTLKVFFVF